MTTIRTAAKINPPVAHICLAVFFMLVCVLVCVLMRLPPF
jgi:hypothetical protein